MPTKNQIEKIKNRLNDYDELIKKIDSWMKELNKHVGNPGENKKGPVVYLLGNKLDKLDIIYA